MIFTKPAHRRIQAGAVPSQDQTSVPLQPLPDPDRMVDDVSGRQWFMNLGAYYADDDGAPAYVGVAGGYSNAGSLTYPLVTKAWTGPLTVLVRAWGLGSSANLGCFCGDLGGSGARGSAMGPNNAGRSGFYIASDANTLKSIFADGAHSSSPTYRDYAYIFDPGVRMTMYRDSIILAEDTVGIPAQRYVANSLAWRVGNRGDLDEGGVSYSYLVGRIRFLYFYTRVLSVPEIEAAFANPGYVP